MKYTFWGAILLVAAIAAAAIHFWSPKMILRVTTGADGGDARRLMTAIVTEASRKYPRIGIERVVVSDLAANSKAIENGSADIALIRSDVSPPGNGQTIAIMRRDAVAFVLPPNSTVDSVAKLSGKTVAIPQGRLQDINSALLDVVLGYYNVALKDVQRVFLSPDDMVAAVKRKHVAAILAVGPVGPGQVVNAVASMAKGSGGTPEILAFSDAEAFSKRFPAFESHDVPEGAFKSRPATPDDTVTTLAVTYRLVVPERMLNLVAGALGQAIFTGKQKLIALTPLASQIEAPDLDDKNPILPVHPGVANYLNNGDQSFFDEFQGYFYLIAAVLSVIGSFATVIAGRIKTGRMKQDQKRIGQCIKIAGQARDADIPTLKTLEVTLHKLVDEAVETGGGSGQDSTMVLAIGHARHSITSRQAIIQNAARLQSNNL